MHKIHFLGSPKKKAQQTLATIKKYNDDYPLEEADVIGVIGGDGFLLRALHKNYNKIILPINAGNVGFLMNTLHNPEQKIKLDKYTLVNINALEISFVVNKQHYTELAFNETYLQRTYNTISTFKINIDNTTNNIIGDGILIATPLGSTGYNKTCGGAILPFDSNLLVLTPLNAINTSTKTTVLTDIKKINIQDISKNGTQNNLFIDFKKFSNIEFVNIQLKKNVAKLMYLENCNNYKNIL